MTKKLSMIFLLFCLAVSVIAQAKDSEETKNTLTKMAAQYVESFMKREVSTLEEVLAENYVGTNTANTVQTKKEVINFLKSASGGGGGNAQFDSTEMKETNFQMHNDIAVMTGLANNKINFNGNAIYIPMRLTAVFSKINGRWQMISSHLSRNPRTTGGSSVNSSGGANNPAFSSFDVLPAPESIVNGKWINLAEDKAGDGQNKDLPDGKSFSYFYDKNTDTLWFRLETYGEIDTETPAVSISIDTDADQSNGVNWYGTNSEYKFEKMISVGPVRKENGKSVGYNGITNEDGVKTQNWINEKKNVASLYYDKNTKSYIMSIKRFDISPNLKKFNVIGSVGGGARWNDDIGEKGFTTIDLNP
jgi:hypothetical protein